jgi:hypothetical protein
MSHDPGKYLSHGVFTSASAVKSRPSHEVARLYFRTTSSAEFEKWDVSPRGRTESLGQIHFIGSKSTKYMPYRYKQAPLPGKDSCWYARDYTAKPSDYTDNKQLAEFFKGTRDVVKPTPSMEKMSHHRQNFVEPSKDELLRSLQPAKAPPIERTKTTGGVDMPPETMSLSHRTHLVPPRLALSGKIVPPSPNLGLSGMDDDDCFRTTYRSDFLKKKLKRSPKRTASAPIVGLGQLDDEESSTSTNIPARADMFMTMRSLIERDL